MTIQNNIAAMRAYNRLKGNQTALSKNLQKLSSGYRVNTAADDAAGLAMSEKMRALITGNGAMIGDPKAILGCSSCGICTNYACHMGLLPSEVMAMYKAELGKAGVRPVPEENIQTDPFIVQKRVPVKRLIARMGLSAYDVPAPYTDTGYQPKAVYLPLRQHVGKPAEPIVKVGDRVRAGDVIAEIPEKSLGARIHASIDGRVTAVDGNGIQITGGESA